MSTPKNVRYNTTLTYFLLWMPLLVGIVYHKDAFKAIVLLPCQLGTCLLATCFRDQIYLCSGSSCYSPFTFGIVAYAITQPISRDDRDHCKDESEM